MRAYKEMDTNLILSLLNQCYAVRFDSIALHRDGGSMSYVVDAPGQRYFLRVVRPQFLHTAMDAINIHLYLQRGGFPVPAMIFAKDGEPYVKKVEADGAHLYILYEYIEGTEPDDADVERVGKLVGAFHGIMQQYPGKLQAQGKHFFIDRYVDILKGKNHPLADAYQALGEALWNRVAGLPRGFCHCDLYKGNVHKAENGKLFLLDFDTCCDGFPMYDVTLFCDESDYFNYSDEGFEKSKACLSRFIKGYERHRHLTSDEVGAFYTFVAIHHFQVQATIVEIYGVDCNPADFEGKQMDWMVRWLKRAEEV